MPYQALTCNNTVTFTGRNVKYRDSSFPTFDSLFQGKDERSILLMPIFSHLQCSKTHRVSNDEVLFGNAHSHLLYCRSEILRDLHSIGLCLNGSSSANA